MAGATHTAYAERRYAEVLAVAGEAVMLTKLVDEYVALRKATGFKFHTEEIQLRSFVAFAQESGDRRVRAATAVEWASQARMPRQRYKRLRTVVRFAEHLRAENRRHELPPARLFASSSSRPTPRIFTEDEISRIVACAAEIGCGSDLRGKTYSTLYGLIATTGMRLSEAISLRFSDVSAEGLTIRKTKFGKSRFLPLHPSTASALESYLRERRRVVAGTDAVFVSIRRGPLSKQQVQMVFRQVAHGAGVKNDAFGRHPRVHDLRHTFAVGALERCPVGRDRVERHIVALTTYLGHARIESTYWYLEATPRLMRDIAAACETVLDRGVR
jgi:integrase/recombinase XerD